MSMNHTREPWELHTEYNSATIKRTTWHEDDPSIGDTSHVAKLNDNWIYDEHGGSAHANGRRIVASVNACAGIPTEALESGVVAEMREALSRILKSHDPTDTTEAMEDDRDFAREVLAKLTPQ